MLWPRSNGRYRPRRAARGNAEQVLLETHARIVRKPFRVRTERPQKILISRCVSLFRREPAFTTISDL